MPNNYKERAEVILQDPASREDFYKILDALGEEMLRYGETVAQELCTDLASILEKWEELPE